MTRIYFISHSIRDLPTMHTMSRKIVRNENEKNKKMKRIDGFQGSNTWFRSRSFNLNEYNYKLSRLLCFDQFLTIFFSKRIRRKRRKPFFIDCSLFIVWTKRCPTCGMQTDSSNCKLFFAKTHSNKFVQHSSDELDRGIGLGWFQLQIHS